jgi:hypothetical protein
MSLGSSLQSAAVSSWSSDSISATAATRGCTSSDREYYPGRPSETMLSRASERAEPLFRPATSIDFNTNPLQPSMSSSRSAVSTSTTGSASYAASSLVSESTIFRSVEASQTPSLDFSLKLDIDLDLSLGINLSPSVSGGVLSSNNMRRPTASSSTHQSRGRGASITKSLSLKNIGSRLGIGKQEIPPVPPLPRLRRDSTEDGEGEMRINSMHFEDISFDVDKFVSH